MDKPSPLQSIATLRETGGFAHLNNWSLIEVSGVDAAQFLQARVTSDVKALNSGDGQESALLDRKAHLVAYFYLYCLDDKYFIVATRDQSETILKELETYLFAEKVNFRNATDKFFWTLQGAYSQYLLSQNIESINQATHIGQAVVDGESVMWVRQTLTGELGFLIIVDNKLWISKLEHQAKSLGLVELSDKDLHTARIEAGLPLVNVDVTNENILPETSLDANCVSYTKGCYLGQEVIARVKAQGAPRRGLMGLMFAPGIKATFKINADVNCDGKSIGQIKSNVYSPTLERTIAFVLIAREYRVPDTELSIEIDGSTYQVKVIALPFYKAKENNERAQVIYESALSLYTKGSEDKAIELLRQAIKLQPKHADSYEMLGVMLGKMGQLDEAIALMKKLEQIDPDSVMAHANLSMFYVQQGDKERAEEEKAIAMSLRIEQATRELSAKQAKEDEVKHKKEEALKRMEMFRQVIAIDADDLLANFGLGNLYVELEQFKDAIPLLRRAIDVKPDYTAAFLALGLALQGNHQDAEAIEIYKQGIAVASKRGDFEPMNKMKERLTALEGQVSTGAN